MAATAAAAAAASVMRAVRGWKAGARGSGGRAAVYVVWVRSGSIRSVGRWGVAACVVVGRARRGSTTRLLLWVAKKRRPSRSPTTTTTRRVDSIIPLFSPTMPCVSAAMPCQARTPRILCIRSMRFESSRRGAVAAAAYYILIGLAFWRRAYHHEMGLRIIISHHRHDDLILNTTHTPTHTHPFTPHRVGWAAGPVEREGAAAVVRLP